MKANTLLPNTHQLIIINIVVAMLCIYVDLDPQTARFGYSWFNLTSENVATLLTASFTHMNAIHMIVNVIGLAVFTALFKPKATELGAVLMVSTVGVGVGAYLMQIASFNGLSAIIHATVTYFALKYALMGMREYWLVMLGVLVKVAHETLFGVTEQAKWLMGGEVATEVHLIAVFGALIGVTAMKAATALSFPAFRFAEQK